MVVAADVSVRTTAPGVHTAPETAPTTTIPAGSTVCVYFVHIDPDAPDQNFDPVIDFGASILGVAAKTDELWATSEFEVDGVFYLPDGLGSPDTFAISGSVLEIHSEYFAFNRDQVRVFTAC